jgi:hypothetical protein
MYESREGIVTAPAGTTPSERLADAEALLAALSGSPAVPA